MSEATWYLRTQDETFGPVSESQLVSWAKLGRVQPGQEVFIEAGLDQPEFVQMVAEACYRLGASRVVVCANLPYYITTPILMRLLESELPVDAITVMVQKEVADRLCARPGEKNAGAITVCVDYYAHAEVLFGVPKGAFLPSPKVDSAVIRLTRREKPAVETNDVKAFFRLVKAAFAQRRKTAVNSISSTLSVPKTQVAKALTDCGLSETVRAEALTSEDFAALYRALGGAP